ncbi:MAG: family transcriptional regulator, cyclic receptor protein [Actinomycetota bacterium]|jgi:CRP-like cAMP-binding protein|nr:family transcriptional regulator, cyclic receptor protein [Actinomycetota bacterium]
MRQHNSTKNPTRDALGRWPGLGGCTDRELDDLAKLVDELTFEPGRVLMREGEHGAEAFMILEGAVEVSISRKVVATLGPGRFVGEMALLENDVRTATATVIKPTKTLVLSRRAFQAVVSRPWVATHIAADLARKVRALETNAR